MGGDGGSIPKRIELVKTKQSQAKLDPNEEKIQSWCYCHLSNQPLTPPIVVDRFGKLYNKEQVLNALLEKSDSLGIKSLKDVTELHLTDNPAWKNVVEQPRFICPMTLKEMNGTVKFIYLATCGHVFSEMALKEMPGNSCFDCGINFKDEDVLVINPSAEQDLEKGKAYYTKREEERKASKKSKKGEKTEKIEKSDKTGKKRKAEEQITGQTKKDINIRMPNLDSINEIKPKSDIHASIFTKSK